MLKTFVCRFVLAVAVLAASAPNAGAAYLFLISHSDNASFRSEVATLVGDTVDYVDARNDTPSLSTLQAYDAVFAWVDLALPDPTLLGDVLADYVDGGGRVVLGAFTTYTAGYSMGGRIMSAGYSPVTSLSGSNHFTDASYAGDGVSALWDGVTSYRAFLRDDVVLQGNGVLDGTFQDGSIAAAYRPDLLVYYLGGMETITMTLGDTTRLLANALLGKGGVPAPEPVVPEPTSLGLMAAGLAALGLVAQKRKQH